MCCSTEVRWCKVNVASTAARLQAEHLWNRGFIPGRCKRLSSSPQHLDQLWVPPNITFSFLRNYYPALTIKWWVWEEATSDTWYCNIMPGGLDLPWMLVIVIVHSMLNWEWVHRKTITLVIEGTLQIIWELFWDSKVSAVRSQWLSELW